LPGIPSRHARDNFFETRKGGEIIKRGVLNFLSRRKSRIEGRLPGKKFRASC